MEKPRLLLWGIIGPLWRRYEKLSARLSSIQRIDYNLSELLSFSEFNFDFFKMEIETHLWSDCSAASQGSIYKMPVDCWAHESQPLG